MGYWRFKMKMLKRGQVGGIQTFVISIVGVAVVLAVGLTVLSELSSSMTADSSAKNSTDLIVTKMATIPTWIGIIITVALAFIVLGFFFAGRK
jgi:hypothetical protein